ncbi:unnamed protein product [Amoebophrya sp. A120]|nr:unnamed protein product [Amoebophrya sp. A120]|eukprot:GSA120T00018668001.1
MTACSRLLHSTAATENSFIGGRAGVRHCLDIICRRKKGFLAAISGKSRSASSSSHESRFFRLHQHPRHFSVVRRLRTGNSVDYAQYEDGNISGTKHTAVVLFEKAIAIQHDWLPDTLSDKKDVISYEKNTAPALQIPKKGVMVYANPDETQLFESRVLVATLQFFTGGLFTVAGVGLSVLNIPGLLPLAPWIGSSLAFYFFYLWRALRRVFGVTAMRQLEWIRIVPATAKETADCRAEEKANNSKYRRQDMETKAGRAENSGGFMDSVSSGRETKDESNGKTNALHNDDDADPDSELLGDLDLHTTEERFEALPCVRLHVRAVNWQSNALLLSRDHPTIVALLDQKFQPWGSDDFAGKDEKDMVEQDHPACERAAIASGQKVHHHGAPVSRQAGTDSVAPTKSSTTFGDHACSAHAALLQSPSVDLDSRPGGRKDDFLHAKNDETRIISSKEKVAARGRISTGTTPKQDEDHDAAASHRSSTSSTAGGSPSVTSSCSSAGGEEHAISLEKTAPPPSDISTNTNKSIWNSNFYSLATQLFTSQSRRSKENQIQVRNTTNEDIFLAEEHNFRKLGEALSKFHFNENLDERTVEHRRKKDTEGFGGLGSITTTVVRDEVVYNKSGSCGRPAGTISSKGTMRMQEDEQEETAAEAASGITTTHAAIFDESRLAPSTKGYIDSQAVDFLKSSLQKLVFDERVTNPRVLKNFDQVRDKRVKSSHVGASKNNKGDKLQKKFLPLQFATTIGSRVTRVKDLFARRVTTYMCPLWVNMHLADFANMKVDKGYSEPTMQILWQGLAYLGCGIVVLATGILAHNCQHRLLASTWAGLEEKKTKIGSTRAELEFGNNDGGTAGQERTGGRSSFVEKRN